MLSLVNVGNISITSFKKSNSKHIAKAFKSFEAVRAKRYKR